MKNTKYEKWTPINDLPVEAYFLSLFDEFTSLTIILAEFDKGDEARHLKFVFDSPMMYRVTPEGSRLMPNDRINSNYNVSFESDLLEWFHLESAGIHLDEKLKYYLICNVDNIIEVITNSNVSVMWDK